MPTFLSKVFSRGKEKEKEKEKERDGLKEPTSSTTKQSKRTSRASIQSLLEGKFEAVSPTVSPSVQKFEEKDKVLSKESETEKEKEKKTTLFRPKSRTKAAGTARKSKDVHHLALDLNLSVGKSDSKRRDLEIVYEGVAVLDDATLGEKRLSLAETLKLVHACSTVITSRGLETLGLMHPHWHSASPATQRKIISLFLSSLAASPTGASTISPSSAASAFELELEYARSVHDVAAVFRWALRHLRLDGDEFGKDGLPSLAWYDGFSEQERAKSYPQTAFSDLLLPVVKPSHAELLNSTLSLVSSLASHSEMIGASGSKLSMFFGQSLLTGNKVDGLEDWLSFYAKWERAGRALEHIFLASLRDEASKTGIPRRLSELIANYPYSKHAVDSHFPRPARFATRTYDALYVRITSELAAGTRVSDELRHPLRIIENAFKSETGGAGDADITALWEELKKLSVATKDATLDKLLSNMLSDETIRLLSLKPDGADNGTPTITMFSPVLEHANLFANRNGTATNGSAKTANGSASVSRNTSEGTTSPITTDWGLFSSTGFGESSAGQSLAATLLDSDLEKTNPPAPASPRSLRKSRSPGRTAKPEPPTAPLVEPGHCKTALVSLVKLDESFIDFWSDALLDPISHAWPAFVVCQLKSDTARVHGDKKITWLIVEQTFLTLTPPTPPEPPSPARRASSPRPSIHSQSGESRPGVVGRLSSTFSASRKRFNFLGNQAATVAGAEKKESKLAKGIKVGELGEVVPENVASSPVSEATKRKEVSSKTKDEATTKEAIRKSDVVAATAAGAAAATALIAADAVPGAPKAQPNVSAAEKEAIGLAKDSYLDASAREIEVVSLIAPQVAPPAATEPEAVESANVATELPAEEVRAVIVTDDPADTADPQFVETEGAAAGVHPGAGESRFVEHIETLPDEKITELEPISGLERPPEARAPVQVAEPRVDNKEVSFTPEEPISMPETPEAKGGAEVVPESALSQHAEVIASPADEPKEDTEEIESAATPESEAPTAVEEPSAVAAAEEPETEPVSGLAEAFLAPAIEEPATSVPVGEPAGPMVQEAPVAEESAAVVEKPMVEELVSAVEEAAAPAAEEPVSTASAEASAVEETSVPALDSSASEVMPTFSIATESASVVSEGSEAEKGYEVPLVQEAVPRESVVEKLEAIPESLSKTSGEIVVLEDTSEAASRISSLYR